MEFKDFLTGSKLPTSVKRAAGDREGPRGFTLRWGTLASKILPFGKREAGSFPSCTPHPAEERNGKNLLIVESKTKHCRFEGDFQELLTPGKEVLRPREHGAASTCKGDDSALQAHPLEHQAAQGYRQGAFVSQAWL